jgi:exodeoxyribonuclease III
MRLLSWNILHGGGPLRLPEIALDLLAHAPDLVVLTEFRPARGGQLRAVLADHGLVHHDCSIAHPTPPPRNAVLFASRWPLAPLPLPELPETFRPRLLAANVQHPTLPVDLLGMHIPDDSNPTGKAHVWRAVLDFARPRADRPCLLAGDTNSGRHRTDDPSCRLKGLLSLGTLATLGFADLWRDQNPQARDASWSGGTGRPSSFPQAARIDAVYASRPLAPCVRRADFVHAPRDAGHSDHSMLLVDLDEPSGGLWKTPPKTAPNDGK